MSGQPFVYPHESNRHSSNYVAWKRARARAAEAAKVEKAVNVRAKKAPGSKKCTVAKITKKTATAKIKKKATTAKKAATMKKTEVLRDIDHCKAPPGAGQALFAARFTPQWPHYRENQLMGLPAEIRNIIFALVLPILGIPEPVSYDQDSVVLNDNPDDRDVELDEDGYKINNHSRFIDREYQCAYENEAGIFKHPLMHTCRQMRYEYGADICTSSTFDFHLPADWNVSLLTCFTQFAASVGVHDYDLTIILARAVGDHGVYRWPRGKDGVHHPDDSPTKAMTRRWANLKTWAKDVFDGVETRLLLAPEVKPMFGTEPVDPEYNVELNEALIVRVLDAAVALRGNGTPWARADKKFERLWSDYLEDGALALEEQGV